MSHYDDLAGLVKIGQLAVLVWAFAVTYCLIGWWGLRLLDAAWNFIARIDWTGMP